MSTTFASATPPVVSQLLDVDLTSGYSGSLKYNASSGRWKPDNVTEIWIPSTDWFFATMSSGTGPMSFTDSATYGSISSVWPASSTWTVGFQFGFPVNSIVGNPFDINIFAINPIANATAVTITITGGYIISSGNVVGLPKNPSDVFVMQFDSITTGDQMQKKTVTVTPPVGVGNFGDVCFVNVTKSPSNVSFVIVGANITTK